MAVNSLVSLLFHVGWGLYMIAETSRMGSQSTSPCDNKDDNESLEGPCSGYGAGAAFSIFAAISAFAAAAISKRGPVSWYPFVGSVALYTLAKVAEMGGQSQFNCHDDVNVDDNNQEMCDGTTAAATFYFFAFALSLAVLALMWKMAEAKHFSVSAFFAFLACFALGTLCEYGGLASSACEAVGEDDVGDDDINSTACSGVSFATFVAAVAMVVGFAYAALTFLKQNTGSNLWLGGSLFFGLYFLGWTAYVGTSANITCDIVESDDDATEARCNGYGAATTFALFATIAVLVAAFFATRGADALKQATFLAGFALYYLAYTSYTGGISAASCEVYNNRPDDDLVDSSDYDDEKAECGGFGAAAFFAIVAFLVVAVAAVLTQLPQGAPTSDEDGQNADASAPQQEKDVPVATAVVVNEEHQQKDGANV